MGEARDRLSWRRAWKDVGKWQLKIFCICACSKIETKMYRKLSQFENSEVRRSHGNH